jgi:uncharacterized protein
MLTTDEILIFLREKKAPFAAKYRIVSLGLFGSFAKGETSENSDIDILVEFAPETEDLFGKKFELQEIIANRSNGREVDICTLKYMKPYFKEIISRSVIYV